MCMDQAIGPGMGVERLIVLEWRYRKIELTTVYHAYSAYPSEALFLPCQQPELVLGQWNHSRQTGRIVGIKMEMIDY